MTTVGRSSDFSFLCRLLPGALLFLSALVSSHLIGLPDVVLAENKPEVPSTLALKKGVLLVAHPSLTDPNFQQTVVLICEHEAEGTLGVIINRPTAVPLSEALPNVSVLKGTSYVLFAGGPVQPDGILMLFRIAEAPERMRKVIERVYLGLHQETLERVITKPQPTETFRAYAGYTGWAPGQLEFEMAMGSWAVIPADPTSIFDKAPETLWAEMVEAIQAPRVIRLE
ncbi:MAG: YqgE/AlgH family protein [Nitrospiraceae bacterium]|nr:YqgE/AlgH family protein [Nitrospiraceae bacterium]MSR24940.1 YqgE/AlgH family protein [Nitrospiraceae bacterium]